MQTETDGRADYDFSKKDLIAVLAPLLGGNGRRKKGMTDKQDLVSAAGALPENEYLLLQLVAVLYEPVSTHFLCKLYLSLDHFLLGEYRPRFDEVSGMLARLRHEGFLSASNQCTAELAEILLRASIEQKRFSRLAAYVEQSAPMDYQHGRWPMRCWRAVRQFRIGLYSQDFDRIDQGMTFLEHAECSTVFFGVSPILRILTCAFSADWFSALSTPIQFYILDYTVKKVATDLSAATALFAYLQDEVPIRIPREEQIPFLRLLATVCIYQGKFSFFAQILQEQTESFVGSGMRGTLLFLQGEFSRSLSAFAEDRQQLAEFAGDDSLTFFGLPGFFYILSILYCGDEATFPLAEQAVEKGLLHSRGGSDELPLLCLRAFLGYRRGKDPDLLELTAALAAEKRSVSMLLALIILHWMGVETAPEFRARLKGLYGIAQKRGYFWLSEEAAALLLALQEHDSQENEHRREESRLLHLVDLFPSPTSWQHSLSELIETVTAIRQPEQTRRLSWFVTFTGKTLMLFPREQRRNSRGKWSKGRAISCNRLVEMGAPYLTKQDREICAAFEQGESSASRPGNAAFDEDRALVALIGHPHVFLHSSPRTPVEIVPGEPELMVERREDSIFLYFSHPIGTASVCVWPETSTRFKVVQIREEHRRVAAITGPRGLQVPMSASGDLLETIGSMASFMTVHSAIDIPNSGEPLETVEGDSTIHIHMIPYGGGFRVELFVRPFVKDGPYLKPGVGTINLIAEIDGRRLRAKRDLQLEEAKAREVEESCPMLDLAAEIDADRVREWHLVDPEACLQVLSEIDAIRGKVILEWPEGQRLFIRRQVGSEQLNLNIRTLHQDWFAFSGQVELEENEVMDLKLLLEKARQTKSRFIQMGDGQFLALTQEFRRRLDELLYFGKIGSGNDKEVKIHSLAAMTLDGLSLPDKTKVDAGWLTRRKAIESVQYLQPRVPSTLKAELRDYQKEGFVWMCRLAQLGFGACLADDMGLGKTLQALGLILSRAQQGPSLVVAPTSVCMNWQAEIRRFAPTLNFHIIAGATDPAAFSFGPYDVVVSSYTLLQQEKEFFTSIEWETIVLDEAQAIKNSATKRSQAAMKLQGRFKLITTGTPIENHLGELWNLFSFINPGLLGSFKQFNRRFGIPIEKHRDRSARKMLKKLIQPFMLRRIKAEVLDELPSRTEVTLRVELGQDERNFYEALRQQALENIAGDKEKNSRQIRILAEIMRLRRACCNPKLIDQALNISSSKEQVFSEVVDELLGGGHKALVFSQFTGHLALLRRFLEEKKVSYRYLDGSTAAAQRQRQVEEFQAGEADFFLISLKAGGLGLNLTAADYVIHMDPWWNPAVEDQAADRAHRIGQTRPVTVYRLVTADTIEEKIVRLHQEKRTLAQSLLEGADASARFSADELLELIRYH